ncbi:MAG: acyl-CoA dehydrogenase family protein [Halobacteriales archaeon]
MISRLEHTAEHAAHREAVRSFCETEVAPAVEEYESAGTFPEPLVAAIGEAGFGGVPYPTELDGGGLDWRSFAITIEELSRAWKTLAGTVNVNCALVSYPIYTFGADWQREAWLPDIFAGEAVGAFSMTEPEAGSDAAGIRTTAERDGDEWVIDGHKVWTTNGSIADLLMVVARTSDAGSQGLSLIGIPDPAERDGVEFINEIPCLEGETALETEIRYDGVRVPADHLVGEVDSGFRYVMEGLDIGRIGTAAQGVGIAQGAFEASRGYAGRREQFGQPIREFEGVGFKLADMAARTEAARLLTHHAADARDRGERVTQEAAMAKFYATDVAMDVATEAVQIHGARGYSTDYPVERYLREAKGTQIYEGTNEINRLVVANRLYEGDAGDEGD